MAMSMLAPRQDLFDCSKNPECVAGRKDAWGNVSYAMRTLVAKSVVAPQVETGPRPPSRGRQRGVGRLSTC